MDSFQTKVHKLILLNTIYPNLYYNLHVKSFQEYNIREFQLEFIYIIESSNLNYRNHKFSELLFHLLTKLKYSQALYHDELLEDFNCADNLCLLLLNTCNIRLVYYQVYSAFILLNLMNFHNTLESNKHTNHPHNVHEA